MKGYSSGSIGHQHEDFNGYEENVKLPLQKYLTFSKYSIRVRIFIKSINFWIYLSSDYLLFVQVYDYTLDSLEREMSAQKAVKGNEPAEEVSSLFSLR